MDVKTTATIRHFDHLAFESLPPPHVALLRIVKSYSAKTPVAKALQILIKTCNYIQGPMHVSLPSTIQDIRANVKKTSTLENPSQTG